MNGLAEQSNVESIDDRLWNDVRVALDSIAQHSEDILIQWIVVGQRLIELRRRNPSGTGVFSAACQRNGIGLTPNQRSEAMWWASLDDRQREVLKEEFPDALTPKTLQNRCREKHPKWCRSAKSHVSPRGGSVKKQSPALAPNAPTQIPPKALPDEAPAPKREDRKTTIATVADRRPPIIMYGVQMWPVTDEERVRLGYYDYEQLAYAVKYFIGLRDIVMRAENDPHEIAVILRTRIRHLRKFVDKSPPSDCKTRMVRFCEVLERLPALLQANHAGECQPPSGKEFTEA